jgi:hypothetical protein
MPKTNPAVAAIQRRRESPCPPLQVANGTTAMTLPDGDPAIGAAVEAAWLPLKTGQAVPMIGERFDGEPCFND